MTLSYQRPRNRGLKTFVLGATAASLLVSTMTVPAQAADESSDRSVGVTAQQTQGLPGQYQMAYSQKSDKLWVTGTSGRPPLETATIAKVDPATMKIEAEAQMPTLRTGTGQDAGYQYNGAYGIAVDDANGTVWVTNTRTSSVSVFDQTTMEQIWTSYDQKSVDNPVVSHPREVKIDQSSGNAFVTDGTGVVAFDLTNYAEKRVDLGEGAGTGMNSFVDEGSSRLYTPDLSRQVVNVIDTKSLKVVQTIALHADDASAGLSPSDVTVDKSLNEVYVSSQGKNGVNSGVTVYDLTTGAYKKSIPFGSQALSITNDEARDLVYVTDFAQGEVGVIDAKSGKVVSSVDTGARGTNDVLVTNSGSVFAVDKAGAHANASVPFTLDFSSGKTRTSNMEQKGYGAQLTPINADTLYKIDTKVTAATPAPAPAAEQVTGDDGNGATVTGLKVAPEGKDLVFSGTGMKNTAGTDGNAVALKLDAGGVNTKLEVKHPVTGVVQKNKTIVATAKADAEGNWSATVPWPTVENSDISAGDFAAGTTHSVQVLSGSMTKGDSVHNPSVEFSIGAKDAGQTGTTEVQEVTPTAVDFQGYGPVQVTTSDVLSDLTFSDVNDSTMFSEDIAWVANKGVATGWPDGTYRPLDNIERGAMAAYLYRLAGSPKYTAPATSQFSDVPTDHMYYKEISWLYASGIAKGWSDGTYRPEDSINRDAMAAFFYRAAGSPEYNGDANTAFKDVSHNDFRKEIAWMNDQKIANGWSDGTYRPLDAIHRDAMAAFVHRFNTAHRVTATA